MNRSVPIGEVRRVGDHALLAGVADPPAARTLSRLINASKRPGLREVIGGVATVLVLCDDPADVEGALPWLVDLADVVRSRPGDEVGEESNLVQIGCVFDGPDIAETAELVSCTPDDVIAALTARPLTVD
ncbi:MAG TPA: carboxyltransferase domain-containing protein, partial [Acidimicrobiales bacterium]|nr:carboxyltransferase domain-containing protein [Acidimicrobiales bacterium]